MVSKSSPFLKMPLANWPVLPPCSKCSWSERLLDRKYYSGFNVRSNTYLFGVASRDMSCTIAPGAQVASLAQTTLGHSKKKPSSIAVAIPVLAVSSESTADHKAATFVAQGAPAFLYYSKDDTPRGSLYWTLSGKLTQFRMPLHTIARRLPMKTKHNKATKRFFLLLFLLASLFFFFFFTCTCLLLRAFVRVRARGVV